MSSTAAAIQMLSEASYQAFLSSYRTSPLISGGQYLDLERITGYLRTSSTYPLRGDEQKLATILAINPLAVTPTVTAPPPTTTTVIQANPYSYLPPRPGETTAGTTYLTGGGAVTVGEIVYTKPVINRVILEQPPSDYLARKSADVPNQWALVDRAITRTAAGGASRPYGVLRADPAAFRRNAERAVYSTELPPATRRERGEPSLPAREPRTAMAEFGSPANVAYLLAACARHGLRADAAAVARFAPRARELLDSDSLALRAAARGAADLAAEVRRLNRAFLDSRAEFAALEGPPGVVPESYAYAAFERDSLRPPGLEGLNGADLRGGFRSYAEDYELGASDARDRYYAPKVRFASGPRVEGFPTRQTSGTGSRRLYERDVGDTLDVSGNSELGYKVYRDSL